MLLQTVIQYKKMRPLITFFLLWCSLFLTKAQDPSDNWKVDTANHFNQPHYPFSNSLTMWILKQKFSLDIYQMEVSLTETSR